MKKSLLLVVLVAAIFAAVGCDTGGTPSNVGKLKYAPPGEASGPKGGTKGGVAPPGV